MQTAIKHPQRSHAAVRWPIATLAMLAAASFLLAGCGIIPGMDRARQPMPDEVELESEESARPEVQLRRDLGEHGRFVRDAVGAAADEINRRTTRASVREATEEWRRRVPRKNDELIGQTDPLRGLLGAWTYAIRHRLYLSEGEGRELFGPDQPLAIDTAREIESHIAEIARLYLPDDIFEQQESEVREFARERPMVGRFEDQEYDYQRLQRAGIGAVTSLAALPFAPIRTVGRVPQTADSIRDFTITADRIADILERFPLRTRQELDILFEENERLAITVASFERLTESSERLATTAEVLPAEVRELVAETLAQLDEAQPELQRTMNEAQALAAELRGTTAELRGAIEEGTKLTSELAGAGTAWEGTAAELGLTIEKATELINLLDKDKDPAAEPGEPFRIEDYRQTALALGDTIAEVRRLLENLQHFAASDDLVTQLERVTSDARTVVNHSTEQATEVINHLAWRIAQLMLLAFVLLAALLFVFLLARNRTTPLTDK